MADQRSPSSFSFTYDVFLSFRGEDTRSGFTRHLLKALRDSGIHTFLEDDKELRKGDEITATILKAIEESRIAIIVFSENYASSSFCLDVLASILDNFQGNHRLIIPVFYGMEPSHVRHQQGPYGHAFKRHEEKFKDNMEKVQKWRNALHQVASLSGSHLGHRHEYEFQFIEEIVEEVSRRLDRAPLHNTKHTVGLESRLEEVYSLLELGSDGVVMVGMYGAGGIGKTTLARAVYDTISHQFEGLCFLDGVRENSNIHGLVHLQNMLLSEMIGEKDIWLGNANKGASIIKHRPHRKKVLLILDDVDRLEQLEALVDRPEWFGPGSRVIITTRDRHLLTFHGVERTYEVQPLNHQDSLQLLSHQVFKQGNFDPRHTEILNELVSYASGLPLALKVIGSYLFGKSEDQWIDVLHRFKRIPPNEIPMKPKTSFDALSKDEQSVFLDIACCFKGYKMVKALDILCAHHGYNVKFHIEVLIDKSLVSISSDGKVILHPLIEDMGKEIIRRESLQEPGKRSRLWFPEDIVHVLKNNTGASKIKIIHLDSPLSEVIKWDGEAFKKMKNLRTLIIRRCHFSEAPKYLPNSLRVLEWWQYPSQTLPSDFNPRQLVIDNLPNMGVMPLLLAELTETPGNDPKAPHISLIVPGSSQTESNAAVTSQMDFQKWMWILVFVVSCGVGLTCNALSSFKDEEKNQWWWPLFKLFPYVVVALAILAVLAPIQRLNRYEIISRLNRYEIIRRLKCCIRYVIFVVIIVYSELYNKFVEPEITSVFSNLAFVFTSLSLSNLLAAESEKGTFTCFLGFFIIQLMTIKWYLLFVGFIVGELLFDLHSSSESFLLTRIIRRFPAIPPRNLND